MSLEHFYNQIIGQQREDKGELTDFLNTILNNNASHEHVSRRNIEQKNNKGAILDI